MDTVEHDGRTTAFRWAGSQRKAGRKESNRERSDRTTGDEEVILYVHGSAATHRVWAAQYAPAGPRHPAVAVDLSGHGGSPDVDIEPGPETLSAYVSDVESVASATGADVLVGNSLGGAVVLQAILDGAVSPAAIVLAGSGAKLTVHERLRELLADDFEGAIDLLHDDDRLFHDPKDERLDRSKAEMRAVGQRVTRRDFLTCHAFDVRERLGEIAVPTLAVCGDRDELTPPYYHEYLAENVRHGEFATVDDAAHLAMVERPDAFNDVLSRFLDLVDVV